VADTTLDTVAARLKGASRITVLTGAGISAASGVPTFRGPQGLWKAFRPEDLATPEAFARDPTLVWEWYDWRRQQIAGCRPNAGHDVLAAWSTRLPHFRLITQNVDGLHERAGAADVVRMHGSIWRMTCWNGCPESEAGWANDEVPLAGIPPVCGRCGGLARPDVVWFGETLNPDIVRTCVNATSCDVFMTVGTSSLVYPAASLVEEARKRGAWTVEVNLEPTPASNLVDAVLQGPAEKILVELDRRLAQ
jgi:NAD-dependent deacetylase